MPETTEDTVPSGPTQEIPFHYVLTLQYAATGNVGHLVAQTPDGIALIQPGRSRAVDYQEIVDELRSQIPGDPDSVALLFFELPPERLTA
jgi:hypothetical protein